MNRGLVSTALVAGGIVFVLVLIVEFVRTPALRVDGVGGEPGTAVERAARRIVADHRDRSLNHDTWNRASRLLAETGDLESAFAELETRLGEGPQQSLSASGYMAYYLGYLVAQGGDEEGARRWWERALAEFERFEEESRPWLAGNDLVYRARTLMRLGRGEEAYAVLRGVPGVESGEAGGERQLQLLARTLAEIGHEQRARELMRGAFSEWSERERVGRLGELVREAHRWSRGGERRAAEAMVSIAGEEMVRVLGEEASRPRWTLEQARDLAVSLARYGRGGEADAVLAGCERVAEEWAEAEDGREWPDPMAFVWLARARALRGDAAGAAEALARLPEGAAEARELVQDEDLRGVMGDERVRVAVRRQGDVAEWPGEDAGD